MASILRTFLGEGRYSPNEAVGNADHELVVPLAFRHVVSGRGVEVKAVIPSAIASNTRSQLDSRNPIANLQRPPQHQKYK